MSRDLTMRRVLGKRNDFCVRYWVCVINYAQKKDAHKGPKRDAPRNAYNANFEGAVQCGTAARFIFCTSGYFSRSFDRFTFCRRTNNATTQHKAVTRAIPIIVSTIAIVLQKGKDE